MLDQVEEIASDEGLQQAYRWLCTRRTDYAPDNDVWRLRWRGDEVKPQIQAALRTGTYRLGAVDCFRREGQTTEVWAARDALVLKATALVPARHLEPYLSERCYHLARRGALASRKSPDLRKILKTTPSCHSEPKAKNLSFIDTLPAKPNRCVLDRGRNSRL